MICHIYPVAAGGGTFHWKWRSGEGNRKSDREFDFFYDCVEDARSHGVHIDLSQAHLDIADAADAGKLVARPKR
ncbi:MAG: hypothetical protein ACXWUH_04160 [Burkholderiales bacterium]